MNAVRGLFCFAMVAAAIASSGCAIKAKSMLSSPVPLARLMKHLGKGEQIERVLVDLSCVGLAGVGPLPDGAIAQIVPEGSGAFGELVRFKADPADATWRSVNFWLHLRGLYDLDCAGGSAEIETSMIENGAAGYCYAVSFDVPDETAATLEKRWSWQSAEPLPSQRELNATARPVGDERRSQCGISLREKIDAMRTSQRERCERNKKVYSPCRP